MTAWAEENQTDFYTKLFPKIIDRDTPQQGQSSVEDLLDQLDREIIDVTPEADEDEDHDDSLGDTMVPDTDPWPAPEDEEFEEDNDG